MFSLFKKKAIKFFPDIEEVFLKPAELFNSIFFPICTIPLKLINKEWKGSIHLVCTNEDPYNEESQKYYDDYSKLEQISFGWESSKYYFMSDIRYFDVSKDWKQWLDLTKQEYSKSKSEFQKSGNTFGLENLKIGGEPKWIQEDRTPRLENEPMTFITQISTHNIIHDMSGTELYLFFSYKHKLVVQISQVD